MVVTVYLRTEAFPYCSTAATYGVALSAMTSNANIIGYWHAALSMLGLLLTNAKYCTLL